MKLTILTMSTILVVNPYPAPSLNAPGRRRSPSRFVRSHPLPLSSLHYLILPPAASPESTAELLPCSSTDDLDNDFERSVSLQPEPSTPALSTDSSSSSSSAGTPTPSPPQTPRPSCVQMPSVASTPFRIDCQDPEDHIPHLDLDSSIYMVSLLFKYTMLSSDSKMMPSLHQKHHLTYSRSLPTVTCFSVQWMILCFWDMRKTAHHGLVRSILFRKS